MDRKVTFVAEIGCNHGGAPALAKRMIDAAAFCGADVVKFQKRDIDSIPKEIADRPRHDVHAYGATEREHRKALEFTIGTHWDLKAYAESKGLRYACSAWDERSANELLCLGLDYIKIPSARNTDFLKWNLFKNNVPLHVALGMTTQVERDAILKAIKFGDSDHVPYACISTYPTDHRDAYLSEISELVARGAGHAVGFSGHHKGIALDIQAALLGASIIERHFTLDRSSKGTDHAASLDPGGLSRVVRDISAVFLATKHKPSGLPPCEIESRKKLKGT